MSVLDHIHYYTSDPDKTAAWFQTYFGAEIVAAPPRNGLRRANLRFGETMIFLSERAGTPGPALGDSELGLNHLAFKVRDVDGLIARMRADGVEISSEPVTSRPGIRGAYVRGPENVRIELSTLPPST